MHARIHARQLALVLALFLITAFLPASTLQPAAQAAAPIDAKVYEALSQAPDGMARFIVVFKGQADLSAAASIQDWNARGRYVMEKLQAVSGLAQQDTLAALSSQRVAGRIAQFHPYWITNVMTVTGDRAAVEALARATGVAEILPETKIDAPEPPAQTSAPEADQTWGIEKIGANLVWSTYNKKGDGMVIGLVDTGVQWDHPALKASYRGWNGSTAEHNYNWWDPAGFCTPGVPCDSGSHGTHTTGISAGGNSPSQGPIGVAPGAKWIMAAGCCASNDSLLSSLQWMAAPTELNGDNPDPSKRPNVVNNSWGGPGGSKIFYDAIANLAASGVVPVFSAGNNGNGGTNDCGSLGSPGDNTVAFNVGSTTSSDGLSSFSSRGSNPFTGAPSPEVTAPGDTIYSSVPTNSYTLMSGTSMAAPHVTGSVALVMSVEPKLVGKVAQVEELLRKTAKQLTSTQTCGGVSGSQVPNNAFGWGRIDVKAAADFVANAGTLSGTVTDAGTGLPLANATVSITRNGYTLTQKTASDGSYSFVAGAGTYGMAAQAYGYTSGSASGIAVTTDGVTSQNFSLALLSIGSISGKVLEGGSASKPVANGVVEILPLSTGIATTTAADGSYTLSHVPFGSQSVRMRAAGYATMTSTVNVAGAQILNFSPAAVTDYVVGDGSNACSATYSWIDATTGTAYNLNDDASVSVTLPAAASPFTFYGNNYSSINIESNGLVYFGTATYTIWSGIVPFEGIPNNQIIGLGDDLNPNGGTQGTIYTKDMGDGRFVIQYDQVQHWLSGDPETFEIILNKNDKTIVVQYQTVSWPEFSNAGIENSDGSRGILYASGSPTPLHDGLAVKYTPFTGKPPTCTVAPTIGIAASGSAASLSWQAVPQNTSYEVHRDTSPYFNPAAGTLVTTLVAGPAVMTWSDTGKVGDPLTNYFWLVEGVQAGNVSGPSNRIGEFDFSVSPGS